MSTLIKTHLVKTSPHDARPSVSVAAPAHTGFKMNGLRMYTKPVGAGTRGAPGVFYSRRGEGPYYLWRYEEELGQWRGSRVISTDFAPRELTMASWKIVPSALQTKLGEHYLD
jgi:hypothetical protein